MPDRRIELRSEEIQDIMTKVPHWLLRWGNVVILLILILLVTLSGFIKYPVTIKADITITTVVPPQKLVAKTTGRIERLLVKNNQHVAKNTPLAVIENAADYNDVFKLKSMIDTLKITGGKFNFPFSSLLEMRLGEVEAAFAVFEKDFLIYAFNRDLKPYAVQEVALNYEFNEAQDRLKTLIEQKAISEKEFRIKKREIERFKKLHDKGVISTQEWDNRHLDYLEFEKNVRQISSSISQMRSSINELNRSSKETQIDITKSDVALFRTAVQSYNHLKKAISDWELNYILRSAISGKVSFLNIWSENQVISAGDELATIIPSGNLNYIGKMKAIAQSSGKICRGQVVNIRLENYPDREFGVLHGQITHISLTPDKEGYILIDVALPKNLFTSYNKEIDFRHEMRGTANIITEDLSLLERLLYQFRGTVN